MTEIERIRMDDENAIVSILFLIAIVLITLGVQKLLGPPRKDQEDSSIDSTEETDQRAELL